MFFSFLQKTYKLINLLSIDVAVGSCTMAYLIACVYKIHLSFFTYLTLALTVWIIYTLDHLIDASQLKNQAITPRHFFHYQHLKKLIYIVTLMSLGTLFIIFLTLPFKMIIYGFLGCFFVGCHILLVTLWGNKVSFFVQKELSIAISYTIGISIPSISLINDIEVSHLFLLLQCFLIAFTNLCIFSYFDYDIDKKQEQTSIVRFLNIKKTKILIYALCCLQIVFNFILISNSQFILFLMTLTLLIIFWQYNFFKKNERYRLLGDFIFLYPIILYFLI